MDYAQMEKIFVAAKERIATPDLWCQYELYEGEKTCMEGALTKATGTVFPVWKEKTGAFNICSDILCDLLEWPRHALYKWNDQPERTHAQVMAAFDLAIAHCQAQQEKFIQPEVGQMEVGQMEMENA